MTEEEKIAYRKNYYLKNKAKILKSNYAWRKKNIEQYKIRKKIHQKKDNGLYRRYNNLKERCSNKNRISYRYYGGRGIKCMWNTYQEFYKDMYPTFLKHLKKYGSRNTTIERIDNNKNYCKENCTWATIKQQNNNKRGVKNYEQKHLQKIKRRDIMN